MGSVERNIFRQTEIPFNSHLITALLRHIHVRRLKRVLRSRWSFSSKTSITDIFFALIKYLKIYISKSQFSFKIIKKMHVWPLRCSVCKRHCNRLVNNNKTFNVLACWTDKHKWCRTIWKRVLETCFEMKTRSEFRGSSRGLVEPCAPRHPTTPPPRPPPPLPLWLKSSFPCEILYKSDKIGILYLP